MRPRAATGAGGTGLAIVADGMRTSTARKKPEFVGMSVRMRQRRHAYTADLVKEATQLMAPATCGAVPVKSTDSALPATSTVTVIGIGPGSIPSSSSTSVKL